MTNKAYKFVIVFMAISLVFGLVLAACAQKPVSVEEPVAPAPGSVPAQEPASTPASTPTPTPTPPAAKQLSYEAKTYTNDQYGFSVQYPKDWVERTELINPVVVAAFGVAGYIPGMSISVADADGPLTADWVVAQTNSLPETSAGKVTSDITPTTLSDGTPAYQYTLKYNYQAFEIKSFCVTADKDGKRIRAFVWTIDSFSPYDEASFSEIAHTLSFK